MKHLTLTILAALTIPIHSAEDPAQADQTISITKLREAKVIGDLGVPLGTYVEIEAIIISGAELRTKEHDGSYLLKVTKVEGKPLKMPPTMSFTVPSHPLAKVANNPFDLYELKHDKRPSQLDSTEIRQLEKDYVGQTVTLKAYECGSFSGIPEEMIWQGPNFHFSTHLQIMFMPWTNPGILK